MFEDEEAIDPRLIDPDEPIEDLVARVRERVLAVDADPKPGLRERCEIWWETRRSRPSRRRSLRGHRIGSPRAVNAALLVVAVGVVGLGVALRFERGDSKQEAHAAMPRVGQMATSSTATSVPTTSTVLGASEFDVPAGWRKLCRQAAALHRDATSQWSCKVTPDIVVEMLQFPSATIAESAFGAHAKPFAVVESPCGEVGKPVSTWARPSGPDAAVGVFACGTTERGSELLWTVNASGVLIRAVRADGDVRRLFDWWDGLDESAAPL